MAIQPRNSVFRRPSSAFCLRTTNYELPTNYMQNKPNFRKAAMFLNFYLTKDYNNEQRTMNNEQLCKTNPIKPNFIRLRRIQTRRLRGYEWLAKKGRNSFYARRRVATGKAGKEALIYMHQEIIEVADGMVADHINHDGMDNRKANLRAATYSQNLYHRRKRSVAAHSKYKGIYWRKKNRKWQARITFERKRICLGYFRNEIDAAKAYDRAARKYHGEFASLNLPKTA